MMIEISLAVMAITLLVLVTILVVVLVKLKKMFQPMQENICRLTAETNNLILKLNEFIVDISNKSKRLDFMFNSLNPVNKEDRDNKKEGSAKIATVPQLIEWLKTSLSLFKKMKEFVKHYVK